jgi:hypothetical protein
MQLSSQRRRGLEAIAEVFQFDDGVLPRVPTLNQSVSSAVRLFLLTQCVHYTTLYPLMQVESRVLTTVLVSSSFRHYIMLFSSSMRRGLSFVDHCMRNRFLGRFFGRRRHERL